MALFASCRRKQNVKREQCSVEVPPYMGTTGTVAGVGRMGESFFELHLFSCLGTLYYLTTHPPYF